MWSRLVRAWHPGERRRQAERVAALAAKVKALEAELRAMRRALDSVTSELDRADHELARLVEVRHAETRTALQLDDLAPILDRRRLTTHARAAVDGAELRRAPIPHLIVDGVLPPDTYATVVAAIPSDVFFDAGGAGGDALLLPPRVATSYSLAVWMCVVDLLKDVVAPGVVDRLRPWLDEQLRVLCPGLDAAAVASATYDVKDGVWLTRPCVSPPPAGRPWHFTVVVVPLPGSGPGPRAVAAYGASVEDVRPLLAAAGSLAQDVPGLVFHIGPDADTRRRLLPYMDPATRQAWEDAGGR